MPRNVKNASVKKSGRNGKKCIPANPDFFRSVLENSLSAVTVIDKEGVVLYESPAMENMLGHNREERIGARGLGLVNPDDMATTPDALSDLVHHPWKQITREVRIKHAGGSWRTLKVYDRNLLNDPAVGGIVSVLLDITELKQREEAQREMEQWAATLIENTEDGIVIVQDGVCSFVNNALVEITGYPAREFVGMSMLDIVLPEYKEQTSRRFEGRLKGEIPPSYFELKIMRKDGEVRNLETTGTVIQYQGKPAIMGIIRDITERKRVNEELMKSREQLRSLSVHMEKVREEERTRISRSIHDDIGQMLAALKIDLSWMRSKTGENDATLLGKLEGMRYLIDVAMERVRSISSELRPGLLDDLGLSPAIEWLANDFEKRTGVKCHIALSMDDTVIDREQSTAFFRVLQEALTNVALHSKATAVKIRFRCQNGNRVLTIEDNGRGITKEQIDDPMSFGLIGMQERASLWGGDFRISAVRRKGTTVLFSLPAIIK